MDGISAEVLCLFLCLMLQAATGEKIYAVETSQNPRGNQPTNAMYTEEQLSQAELHGGLLPCPDCYKRKTSVPTTIANKINFATKTTSPISQRDFKASPPNKIVPKESEKIEFSRKYNPGMRITDDDGFVPVPGPYGMKTRLTRARGTKPSPVDSYKPRPAPRNVNSVPKSSRGRSYPIRNSPIIKRPQDVQRRSQYRTPKAREELTVKESIANENILGNGNFEIIRGGIYSDQDANEILGSRRVGRGFGPYVVPTYRQSRHTVVQNVQFPPYYQRRVQNPVQPMFYPRAPY